MNMAEVGYQVKNSVLYTVGSEETEPLDGWPYDTMLAALSQQSDMLPTDLSKLIVRHCIDSYKGSGEAVTQSALDLSVSPALASAVKSLVTALKAGLKNSTTRMAIADARNCVQEYDIPDNIIDLMDFCQLLKESSIPATMKSACDPVISAIRWNSGFVISSGYYGAPMRRSNGVAIYFPTRIISPLYSRLDFVKKTGWGTFLKAYINEKIIDYWCQRVSGLEYLSGCKKRMGDIWDGFFSSYRRTEGIAWDCLMSCYETIDFVPPFC